MRALFGVRFSNSYAEVVRALVGRVTDKKIAFSLAFWFILIRSAFRVAELARGFDSKLANLEKPFMILEGGMMLGATILMTIWYISFPSPPLPSPIPPPIKPPKHKPRFIS